MNVKELFQKAFALVRNPDTWTQGESACDKGGESTSPKNPLAVRWCSIGALRRFVPKDDGEDKDMDTILEAMRGGDDISIAGFNDTHTHAEVIAMWERVGKANGWLS